MMTRTMTMTMKLKHLVVPVTGFKMDDETGVFTCYGNVKNVIDHVKDRAVDGCYRKSIQRHAEKGTTPKMLWAHNPYNKPVGKWLKMEEDEKGLKLTGKLSKTTEGKDIEILAKDGALDSFSIGYITHDEKWNDEKGCNDLIEIDIKEVSWVNFACNEESTLQSIKSHLLDGELPTKRELQTLLREVGLSKSQAEKITDKYDPEEKTLNIKESVAKLELFK